MFFLVHGGQYLIEFCVGGGVVALAPVEERVVTSGGGVEVVWAFHCHDPQIMLDEGFGNAACMQQGDDRRNVTVHASVVVPEEPYSVCDTEVVVDEAGKEGICLILAEGVLGGPGSVVFSKSEEVMVPQVYACPNEVRQEWMAFMECQDVQGLK